MSTENKNRGIALTALVFVGLPLLLWATGDYPRRTALKESLSVLTLLAFSLMLGQFFLSRINPRVIQDRRLRGAVRYHKVIGYVFVVVLLTHPFLIVLPRFYESGVDPLDAFVTLITTFESTGVVLGLVSWGLLVVLGLTSLVRGRLPMKANTWRVLHGVLSLLFVGAATWHAVDLGRHTDRAMSVVLIAFALAGASLLLKSYIVPRSTRREASHG